MVVLFFEIKRVRTPISFSVPSVNIQVDCIYAFNEQQAQKIADTEYGTIYHTVIGQVIVADHFAQGFADLPDIKVGDSATFGDVGYICSYIEIGYSIDGIWLEDGSVPIKADLYAITCTGKEEYQIYIVGLDKI